MLKDNKGQITLFIIMGVALLAVVIIFALLLPQINPRDVVRVPEAAQPLQNYVQSCLQEVGEEAIQVVGTHGGYTRLPTNYLNAEYSVVAYAYDRGKDTFPTKETVQDEISYFVSQGIDNCLGNLTAFTEQGYSVQRGGIFTDTIMRENDVRIHMKYSLKLSRDNSVIETKEYIYSVPVRLGHIYDLAQSVNAKTLKNPDWIDMTYLTNLDVEANVLPYDEDQFVYSFKDPKSVIKGNPYVFLFANRIIANKAPVITMPDALDFNKGQQVSFRAVATDPENDQLKFSDDTPMFDITPDGLISFTASVAGEFDVLIRVEDSKGNSDEKTVKFIIKEVQE